MNPRVTSRQGRTVYVAEGTTHIVPTDVERLLRVEIRAAINSFLNAWRIESEAALRMISPPAGDPVVAYAWISLAGNMVWAATAFLPQAQSAVWATRLMSVLGAGVPSIAGIQQASAQPVTPPSQDVTFLVNSISASLSAAKDAVDVTRLTDEAYTSIVTQRGVSESTRAGERERLLWEMIFNVAYDNRAANVRSAVYIAANQMVTLSRTLYPEYQRYLQALSRQQSAGRQPNVAGSQRIGGQHCAPPHHQTRESQPLAGFMVTSADSYPQWLMRRPEYLRLFGLRPGPATATP
ncbi:MAG TPA: hypothetical protein VER03_12865 [Bryobacteraceae bacterium]|nr:hypothetical protein [Bryobacteraceae bacterium]